MKSSTVEKLPIHLKDISTLFYGGQSAIGYGSKRLYKRWQQLLNAYINYYDLSVSKNKIQPITDDVSRELGECFIDFKKSLSLYYYNRMAGKASTVELLRSPLSATDYLELVNKDLKSRGLINSSRTSGRSRKVVDVVDSLELSRQMFGTSKPAKAVKSAKLNPVKSKAKPKPDKEWTLIEPKVSKDKPNLDKMAPVTVKVGNRLIDTAKLMAIPGVREYLEQQQISVVKDTNRAKALELQSQIESLGFDVTLS